MKRKKSVLPLLLLVMFLFAACGRSAASEQAVAEFPMEAAPAAEVFVEEMESSGGAGSRGDSDVAASGNLAIAQDGVQERLIIRTGDLSIVVEDTEQAMARITQMVEENGGWVVSSSAFQYDETAKTGNMTVRVPAEGFQSFLEAVQLMAIEVTRVSTSGQDVTEEYVDLSARLENLELTADRVREFLDEARNVEEALQVNQELSRLEGEIEVITGRMQYLEQSASYSTVNIDLTPDILSQPIEIGGWRPEGVFRNALEALVSALQGLVNLAIWLVIFVLPILLIIAIPIAMVIFLVRRYLRARRSRRQELAAPLAEPGEQSPADE